MSLGIINFKPCSPLLMFVRYGHRLRGKRPGVAKSLAQRLEGEFHHRSQNCSRFSCHRRFRHKNLFRNIFFPIAEGRREDPELCRKNDIGFPFLRPARSAELKQRLEQLKAIRKDPNLEQLARKNKCKKFLKVLCDLAADFFFCFLFKWKLIWTRRSRTGWKQLDRSTSGRLRSITACSSICLASTHSSHLAFGWRSMWVELFGLSVRWSNFFYDLSLHNRTARSTQFITATESNRSRLNKRRRWSSTQSFRWLTMSRPAATRCGRWFWRTPTDIWRPRIRNTSTGWCKKMKLKISL